MKNGPIRKGLLAIVCITGLLILTGSDEGACDPEEPKGDPPSDEIQELLDVLRTADDPACQRDGEGWPLEECPPGCERAPSPSTPFDAENECHLTSQQLGGPPVCIEEQSSDQECGGTAQCWVDIASESVWLFGGSLCYSMPGGWKRCPDYPADHPLHGDGPLDQCEDDDEDNGGEE